MEGTKKQKALVLSVGIAAALAVDLIVSYAFINYVYVGPLVLLAEVIVSGFSAVFAMSITIDGIARWNRHQ
jgi:hypothetical protein